MTLLLDLDGVVTNIEKQLRLFSEKYFNKPIDEEILKDADWHTFSELVSIPSFFETLEPIEDAIENVRILNEFYDIYIVTAPGGANISNCLREKQIWIEKYLPFLENYVVMTKHKYLVQGDYLIDDSPSNLNHYPGKTICFEQFWNKDKVFLKEPEFRAKNWDQLLRYLLP